MKLKLQTWRSLSATALVAFGFAAHSVPAIAQTPTWSPPADAKAWIEKHDPRLRLFLALLYAEGERNAVLNFKQLGLAAMQIGNFKLAGQSFDAAIERVSSVYSDKASAEKAKSIWSAEKVKDFKGDPYERSMLYYYRGLVYLTDGEWDNASASFRAADFQSTVAEEGKQRSDFGLMNYLAAFTAACNGSSKSTVEDLYKLAVTNDSLLSNIPTTYKTVALIESGGAPVKYSSEPKNAMRVMASDTKASDGVRVAGLAEPQLVADLTYQASSRGGRVFDAIIAGKVDFKANSEGFSKGALAFGKTATDVSAQMSQVYRSGGMDSRQLGNAGAAIGAVAVLGSMFADAVASSVEDSADLRHWTNLPAGIFLAGSANSVPIGDFVFKGRRRDKEEAFALKSHRGECHLAWGRTHSALAAADNGTAELPLNPVIVEGSRADANKAFRLQLLSNFQ